MNARLVRTFMPRLMALCALLTLCVAFAAPVSAGGGNSTAAQLCQKGNWQNLERQDGTTFKNQGDCVSYAAQGGALVPIPPEVSVSVTSEGGGNCLVTLSAAHFSPFTHYPASVWLYYLGRKSFDWGGNITTDRLGSASAPFGTYYGSPTESVVGTVNGVSSSSVPFTC